MRKSVNVEFVTQNVLGQTDALTKTISDYMAQEKLYSLKK